MNSMKTFVAFLIVGALGSSSFAQRGRVGTGTPQVDTAHAVVVAGVVTAFQAGVGMGQPTLTVKGDDGKEYAFVLGPYPYLLKQGFAAAVGELVQVTAYPCPQCPSGLTAAQVVNLTRNLTLNLRAEDGSPLWVQPAGGRGVHESRQAGSRQRSGTGFCQGVHLDLAQTSTFQGTVTAFLGGPGQKNPLLTLNTQEKQVELVVSPYRVLAEAGYTPSVGSNLRVVAAPCTQDGRWVVLTLEDLASGLVIRFREDGGQPVRR